MASRRCSVAPIPFAHQLSHNASHDDADTAMPADILVVDCTDPAPDHPHLITHHKGQNVAEEIMADTSSGSVLNALTYDSGRGHPSVSQCRAVISNHFDIDSFLSVWCAAHPAEAVAHEAVLRRAAHIGDFRELGSLEDPVERDALAICCWLNTQERELFYRPFEELELLPDHAEPEPEPEQQQQQEAAAGVTVRTKVDGTLAKFAHFLPAFGAVLASPAAFHDEWQDEYDLVCEGVGQLADSSRTTIREAPELGLVMVETTEPTHYYALFGCTAGFDTVLTQYADGRCEVESKYTTFVDLRSRPVPPRIDMTSLVPLLNTLEVRHAAAESATTGGGDGGASGISIWMSEGLTDPGHTYITLLVYTASHALAENRLYLNEIVAWQRQVLCCGCKRLVGSSRTLSATVREIPGFGAIFTSKKTIYQDRLRTNVKKT